METGQNQLLLAWVPVDIANCIDTRLVGLEVLGIDLDLIFFQIKAPACDWAKLWRKTKKDQQVIQVDTSSDAVTTGNFKL